MCGSGIDDERELEISHLRATGTLAAHADQPLRPRRVLLRRRRAGRCRGRSAGADGPPGHERAGVEGDDRLRQLGARGRAPRLRLVLDDRAPLPARGLRGRPERHPAVDVDRRPHRAAAPRHDVQRRAAVEPAAPRRGLLDAAQPVRRPRHPRRRPRHRAARGAAPQRQGRVDRLPRQPRPGRRRRPQPARVRGVDGDRPPGAGPGDVLVPRRVLRHPRARHPRSWQHRADVDARAPPAVPVRDLAGRHQPADAAVRPGRRPRGGVLEPAPLVHQAVLGHATASATPRRTTVTSWPPASGGCSSSRCASRTPTRRPWRRRRPGTTSSGSSSARTGGAGATWVPTASRRRPG